MLLSAILFAAAASGCTSTHGASPSSGASTPGVTSSTIPIAETVAGMHYVQLRAAVGPVANGLKDVLAGRPGRLPTTSALDIALNAIKAYGTAAVAPRLSGQIETALAAVKLADDRLESDLTTLIRVTRLTAPLRTALNEDASAWLAAESAADAALGVRN